MNNDAKISVAPGSMLVTPHVGMHIIVECPSDSIEDTVKILIGHGYNVGQWYLTVLSPNGNIYVDKNSGGLIIMPAEVTDPEISFPDRDVHLIRLESFLHVVMKVQDVPTG